MVSAQQHGHESRGQPRKPTRPDSTLASELDSYLSSSERKFWKYVKFKIMAFKHRNNVQRRGPGPISNFHMIFLNSTSIGRKGEIKLSKNKTHPRVPFMLYYPNLFINKII